MNNDDYDSPWKEAVEQYFTEFMAFYFPKAYTAIDWEQGYAFLDQELAAVVRDAELGKRYVDKLVRVSLQNGDEQWVYIHIEVQGTQQAEFAKRMFIYNYRLFDRYDRPIASMAVLADEQPHWKPTRYGYELLGCKHHLTFPVAKLTDYHAQLDSLLQTDNAFALMTAAHILTQRTRKNDHERYQAKWQLVRLLYQRDWGKQKIIDLFHVIDWLMRLPETLEQQLWHEIETLEEQQTMRYVSSVERIGIAKGRQEGLALGAKMLSRLLEHRFGALPDATLSRVMAANEEQLNQWLSNALEAATLAAVFNDDKPH
jgi:hypothetical protein